MLRIGFYGKGGVQVSQRSMHALNEWYEFQKRGEIFAEGVENERAMAPLRTRAQWPQ